MEPYNDNNNINYYQTNSYSPDFNQMPITQNFSNNNQHYIINKNMRKDPNLLIYKIRDSIIIDAHAHPLYCCFTPERKNYSEFWTCNNCGNNYPFDIPSFYCTSCDYDFCQNCLMKLPLSRIKIFHKSNKKEYKVYKNPNNPNYKPNIHEHTLALIQLESYHFKEGDVIHCRNENCKNKNISINDSFYYCSLCSLYLCKNCFNNPMITVKLKPEYNKMQSINNIQQTNNNIQSINNIQQSNNQLFIEQYQSNISNNSISIIKAIPTYNDDLNNNQFNNAYEQNQNINNQDMRNANFNQNQNKSENNGSGLKISQAYLDGTFQN